MYIHVHTRMHAYIKTFQESLERTGEAIVKEIMAENFVDLVKYL